MPSGTYAERSRIGSSASHFSLFQGEYPTYFSLFQGEYKARF